MARSVESDFDARRKGPERPERPERSERSERSWDFARELRSLRDSCARSRTEEMQALRRSSEEVERCVLRRQLDESSALQDFLGGLHEDLDWRFERLRETFSQRLELLEERMSKTENEGSKLGTLDSLISHEVQRSLTEAFRCIERSADLASLRSGAGSDSRSGAPGSAEDACNDEEETSQGFTFRLQRFGAKLVTLAEERARVEANQVAGVAMASALPELQERLCTEAQQQHAMLEEAQEAALKEAEVVKRAATQAEAALEGVAALKPHLCEELQRLEEEMQLKSHDLEKKLHCQLLEASAESRSEEQQSRAVQEAALGHLETSLREALSTACAEATHQAEEAQRQCQALERSLIEEAQRGREDHLMGTESAEALVSLERNLEVTKETFLQEQKGLRQDLLRGQRELTNELKPQLAELTMAFMRGQELTEEAQKAVARCDAAWRPEVKDLRSECQSSLSSLRSQAAATQKMLDQLQAEKNTLAKGLRELQRQGVSHEWRVPRLQQRLEYLSMDSPDAKGEWIDSPEFELVGLGPGIVFRFYPRGVASGDGLCAVGVFAPSRQGRSALPLRLDLRLGELRKRAVAQSEADGVLWMAHSFSTLSSLKDELEIGVDIPPFAWSQLERLPSASRVKETVSSVGPPGTPGTPVTNPFCKAPANTAQFRPRLPQSVERERFVAIPMEDATSAGVAHGPETMEGHRSVPNSPHGSSSSASARPGWAAFGGEELPKRPFSAHVPRSCVSQPMPVLLGSVPRRSVPCTAQRSGSNPFANERCGNPFDK